MYRHLFMGILLLISTTVVFSEQLVSLSGVVVDDQGNFVENALVRLETLGYVSLTGSDGSFLIDNTSPVLPYKSARPGLARPVFQSGILSFSLSAPGKVIFEIYSLQGRMCDSRNMGIMKAGEYALNTRGLFTSNLKSGSYILRAFMGKQAFSCRIVNYMRNTVPFSIRRLESRESVAKSSALIDNLLVEKLGYSGTVIPLEMLQQDVGEIVITKTSDLQEPEIQRSIEDSLFQLLIDRIKSLDSVSGPDDLKAIDFISLRNGFEAILAEDSTRIKSNVGLMVSSLLSLNTSRTIWNIVDSLDAYISAHDEMNSESPALMKKAMQKGGVLALGKAMAVQTPEILMATTQKPSFPKFLTLSYLQNTIEWEILPVLNKIVSVAGRIEGLDNASLLVDVDGDTFELDKGEIYLFDAYIHLVRGYLSFYCIYDMDMMTSPEQQDYSWIDSINNIDKVDQELVTIRGDTLYNVYLWDDSEQIKTLVKTFRYNLEERTEFMTIRRNFHSAVLNDLRSVPLKIKEGLAEIRAESDDQENDLLKIAHLDSLNGDMLDISGELRDRGFSAGFADNFSTIDNLMNFFTQILENPYTVEEIIDSHTVSITVDLSAFFTNPVTDLRQLLPKYIWTSDIDWVKSTVYEGWSDSYWGREFVHDTGFEVVDTLYYFDIYYDKVVDIPEESIDSIVPDEWGGSRYYISTPLNYYASIDSSFYIDPLRLIDDDGNELTPEQMEELIDNKMFFPYFDDYTFNGLFPGMTRSSWLDLLWGK